MCIIAIKPKNKKLQSEEILKECFTRNHDGAGYMFTYNDEVIIKKGFMTYEEFYKSLNEDYFKYELENKNLVMHFRIGTSGKSKTGCTHPFSITNNYTTLEKIRQRTNIGICHNGIINMYHSHIQQYSDTEMYIANIMTPMIKLRLNAYKFSDIQKLILDTTKSKWAILDKFGDVYTIGDFIEDNGYMYSNSTYKKIIYTPLKTTYNYNYDDYDYDDATDWYFNYKQKQKEKDDIIIKCTSFDKHGVKYVMANTNNIIICSGTRTYIEVENNNKYYFDKQYNIYTKSKDNVFDKIGTNGIIYTDDSFSHRRDFNY